MSINLLIGCFLCPKGVYLMKKKENARKETPAKNKPVKIIVVPVYIGNKSISEIFLDVIYQDLLAKTA